MKHSSLHQDKARHPKTFNRWILFGCLVVLAVAVGFHFGQRVPVSPLTILEQFAIADDEKSDDLALGLDSHSLPLEFPKPLLLVIPAAIESVTSAEDFPTISKDRKHQVEIEYLSSTASRLRKRVASLEWETLTLESDLLTREIELGKALDELEINKRQRHEVYNITNVPVGGYVAPAPMLVDDAVQAPQRSEVASLAPPVSASLQADIPERLQEQEPFQQSVFYGPAPDRYEDLVDTDFPLTPHQAQTQEVSLRNGGG